MFYVDVLFKDKWVAYGVPGEEPRKFFDRLEALTFAKRLATNYNKECRVRVNDRVQGVVKPNGDVEDA